MIATPARSESQPAPAVRDYISYSALSTYQQCPLRYYFKYVAGLPEETVSASLVFGGAIHSAVELHFRELLVGNPAPALDVLLQAYQSAWRERATSIKLSGNHNVVDLAATARRMLLAFQRSEFSRPAGTIIGVEEELRGRVIPGLPDLLARLDLVIDTPEALLVTDLKTARSRWSREHADDSAEQLLLYSELAKHLVPGKPIRLEFAVITKTSTPAIDRHVIAADPGRVDRTKRIAQRVWRAIESGVFSSRALSHAVPKLSLSRTLPAVAGLASTVAW